MARKRPCLDAEVRAFDLLERRDFLTKTDAMDVLRRIPSGEWARRHGGKMLMFGAYQRVATGMRSTARRYPLTTRLLTRIVRQWSPETYWIMRRHRPTRMAGTRRFPGWSCLSHRRTTAESCGWRTSRGTPLGYIEESPIEGSRLMSPLPSSSRPGVSYTPLAPGRGIGW